MTITDDLAVVREALTLERLSRAATFGQLSTEALAALDRIEREYAEEVALNESAIRARLAEAERVLREIASWSQPGGPVEVWQSDPQTEGQQMVLFARAYFSFQNREFMSRYAQEVDDG